jgi:hypothetical protein
LDELQLQTGFAKSGWVATFVKFVGVAVMGAKTEAFFLIEGHPSRANDRSHEM